MFKEFKEFAMRGNVIDMAVGIIIGAAFGAVVSSLVADIIMPPIGVVVGGLDFSNMFLILKDGATPSPYVALKDAQAAGAVTLNYGLFITKIISFLIVSFAVFMLVKGINRLRRELEDLPVEAPANKACPYCMSTISIKATRCPQCTSELAQ